MVDNWYFYVIKWYPYKKTQKEGIDMNTAAYEKEAPSLSRDEAIAILDTPDEELEALIDRASSLRYKYKGNRVSIHILTNARKIGRASCRERV